MIGVYKITSPTNKIYIGQSTNIEKRKKSYSKLKCKDQTKLYSSLIKYGWENHTFEIIEELDSDKATQTNLDKLEIEYIKLYKDINSELLNIREGGLGGKLPKSSIALD